MMQLTLKPDHRFTLLLMNGESLTVVADWRSPCWLREPVYTDDWASVIYFDLPQEAN